LADVASRSNNMEGKGNDNHTDAHVEHAQTIYGEVFCVSGRTYLTIEELLTILSQKEFGTVPGADYGYSEEALGRQFYYWCGSDGLCQGDQLWQFLGSLEAWYGNTPSELFSYIVNERGVDTAERILNQEPSWKTGNQWNRPFVFGNLSMYPDAVNAIIAAGQGIGAGASWVLRTDQPNPFIVWTPEQRSYWKNFTP
jgi:hypothetical protein